MNIWSLRLLGKHPLLRKGALRAFRFRYRDNRVYTIPRGPLRGYRWLYREWHQFWLPLGAYETETAGWLMSTLKPGSVFFDIGANAGYFTLLGSRAVGPSGKVIAFEPVAENAMTVNEQLKLNSVKNASVATVALSNSVGTAEFVLEERNANSHFKDIAITHALSNPARIDLVEMTTVDQYVTETGVAPTVLKIDVEGGELRVLEGAKQTLISSQPECIVSTHSEALKRACAQFLRDVGYHVESLGGFEHELIARRVREGEGRAA